MKLVSVIVPCYNQAQYLDECLQSVLNQTYTNWECIIINDGSTDNTAEVSKKWIEKDNRFFYYEKENGGVSTTRNYGIRKSTGTFILPLDGDDYIGNNYIETCVKEFESNLNTKLVYGKAIKFGELNEEWDLPAYSFENLLKGNMIYCTALYKRSDFDAIDGYDENMIVSCEDWEFWIRLLKNGGDVIRNQDCIFYYRIKENSRNTNLTPDYLKINTSYNYIYNKHHNCYEIKNAIELYNKYDEVIKKLDNLDFLTKKDLLKIFIKKIKLKLTNQK
jgi:glycosyltransferase involved in cell wall biosynthesis